MNKKAQVFFDLWDSGFSLIIFFAVLFLFSIYVNSQKINIEKVLDDKDIQVQRDRFLIDYLKTPISETTFAKENPAGFNAVIDSPAKQKMTIGDLFVMTASNGAILEFLSLITRGEQMFAPHSIYLIYPDGHEALVNNGFCITGKTSIAYLPMENGNKVGIRVMLCSG